MRAIWAWAPAPSWWRGSRRRTWCCCSAGGSARCRPRATPCSTSLRRRPGWCTSTPIRTNLGQLYQPILAIPASPRRAAPALAALEPPREIAWAGQAADAHADYLSWSQVATPQPGGVNFGEVMVWLREHLQRDAILCNGAGGYAAWLHRFYRFRELNTHIAPASATMGYGPPAAIAMKRLYPDRQVVSLSGDGDFLMNGQEFATQVQYGLPIVNLVVDNASYGSIRLFQEREFPGRVVATDLKNPDFAAYARAFGGFGATVERTGDFAEAFQRGRRLGQAGDRTRQGGRGVHVAGRDAQPGARGGCGAALSAGGDALEQDGAVGGAQLRFEGPVRVGHDPQHVAAFVDYAG